MCLTPTTSSPLIPYLGGTAGRANVVSGGVDGVQEAGTGGRGTGARSGSGNIRAVQHFGDSTPGDGLIIVDVLPR